jgi:predicted O-methyltransferase YrrM
MADDEEAAVTAWDAEQERRDLAAAARLFPGPAYLEVLGWLHAALAPRWYLEVGVDTGASLARARPGTACIGVDPAPAVACDLPPGAVVVTDTSDGFFASDAPARLLGGARVDFCFLDGLHTYDQTLRDFVNAVPLLAPGATVAFHDVVPLDGRVASRTRRSVFWTGDVWKIVPILQRFQPQLDLLFVPTAPSGLLLVRGADAATMGPGAEVDAAVAWARDLAFDGPARECVWTLPRCGNSREAVREALAA